MIEELKWLFTFGKAKKETKQNPVIDQLEPPKMEEPKKEENTDHAFYCFRLLSAKTRQVYLIYDKTDSFNWRVDEDKVVSIVFRGLTKRMIAACTWEDPVSGSVFSDDCMVVIGETNRVVYAKFAKPDVFRYVELTRENFDKLVGAK